MSEEQEKSSKKFRETKESAVEAPPKSALGWKELYLKEDWWAIYLGIGIVLISLVAFLMEAPS